MHDLIIEAGLWISTSDTLQVSRLLNARWPHARVHQFGSTANSLSICNNNDIDVCLEIVEPEGETVIRFEVVSFLAERQLTEASFLSSHCLPAELQIASD